MLDVEVSHDLSVAQRDAIGMLASGLEARLGAPPLNDAALVLLDSGPGSGIEHLLLTADGRLVAYAQIDPAGGTAEVVAEPDAADDALAAIQTRRSGLLVWAHGRNSPVIAAARQRGYLAERTLWQLRRPLAREDVDVAAGVTIRTFVPGQDESAWLKLNAAAFATHSEQGHWTMADLTARQSEDWFDPAGFFLAERDGALVGFHWTKVHPDGFGEVYVLAVSPQAQGMRLGKTLLAIGLNHLVDTGQHTVLLYVDDDNTAAMALYEHDGFTRFDVDVQYRAT